MLTLAAPENIEAIGDAGIAYSDETDLADKLQRVLRDGSLVQSYRHRAQARVQDAYDWDYVVDQYEDLLPGWRGFLSLIVHSPKIRPPLKRIQLKSRSLDLPHPESCSQPANGRQ